MNFTFSDLFAGIGGFHAALEHHGGRAVFVSEIDSSARSIYSQNWLSGDEGKIDGDITLLTEGSVRVPKHDVLTGGFPCQPFSKSGNQHGVAEARGTLFYNILRVIEAKKPELILLENVRNLVGPNHINDYRTMIRLIRDLGYVVSDEPTILSPHEIPESLGGTPQHRERVFIGAVRLDKKRANRYKKIAPLLERHPFSQYGPIKWDLADFLEKHSTTLQSALPPLTISPDQERALRIWNRFVKLNNKENGKPLPGLPLWTEYWKPRSEMRLSASLPDWKRRFIERNSDFYTENQNWINPWRHESKLEDLIPSYRKFEWQAQENKDLYKCLIQFRPSGIRVKAPSYVPAFVAMAQTPVIGWEKRSLSVEEAKALQGFPQNFEFGEQRASISFKQIGNAVHVGVAGIVFQALVKRARELDQNWANELTIKNSQMKLIPSTPPFPNM